MSTWTAKGVVAWADTDASGRCHFTAAYRWAENAEHELYRAAIPGIDVDEHGRPAPVPDTLRERLAVTGNRA